MLHKCEVGLESTWSHLKVVVQREITTVQSLNEILFTNTTNYYHWMYFVHGVLIFSKI